MAVKTVEAQSGNGNGCGKEAVDSVEKIFCSFGAALNRIAVEVGTEALTGVNRAIKAPVPPEQALAFAEDVTAKNMIETLEDDFKELRSPFAPDFLVAAATAKKQILDKLYSYYKETNEQAMTSLALAIREQIRQR